MRKGIQIVLAVLGPRLLADRVEPADRCRLAEAAMGLSGDRRKGQVVTCTCPGCQGVTMGFPPHVATCVGAG